MERNRPAARRDYLRALGAAALMPLSGCNTNNSRSSDPSTETVSPPTKTRSPTPQDNQPPSVERFDAIPEEAGTVLNVSMEVSDNRELAWAEIGYGTQSIKKQLEGREAEIDERLADFADSSSDKSNVVRYRVVDEAENETSGSSSPDTTPPSLTVEPHISNKAGTIELTIEGKDNVGLSEVQIFINGVEVLRDSVIGQKTVSQDIAVSTSASSTATVGEPNRLAVSLVDTLGNSTRQEVEQYVRKYDKMEDTRLDLGGLYMSQAGDALTNNLSDEVDTEPAVGIYNSPIPPEITSRHIDQMTGFGFTHVGYDFGGMGQREWAEAFLKSDLINEVDIMPTFIMPIFERTMDESWKDDVIPRNLSYLREKFLSRDNAVTIDGRPVLDTWNWRVLAAHDEKREKLLDEFGSFEAFANFVRNEARTNRREPYILFGIGAAGAYLNHQELAPLRELAKQFASLRTWFHGTRGGWDDVIDRAIADFEGCRTFAEEHDMEFIPIARPGYDERWDTGDYRTTERYLPRDPERFRQLLQLADQYRTTDRIFVPFNDWIEGHTIEPGTFTGTDFGTEYLEIVKEFQQPNN